MDDGSNAGEAGIEQGVVITVLGPVEPSSLGATMMHEHVFFDGSMYFRESEDSVGRVLSEEPLSLKNLWWARYNPFHHRDVLVFDDFDDAVVEASMLIDAGGRTLVDATPRLAGYPRPLSDLARVSEETGLNIVKGCGYYIDGSYRESDCVSEKSVDELTADMVADIAVGDPASGVRSGIIGEIGCSWPLTQNEEKVLRASANAQIETGASITIHPGRNESAPLQIRDILASSGADLTRIIIGHIDRVGYTLRTRRDLADSGCVLEYDFFGWEGHYPAAAAVREGKLPDMPNDLGRVKELRDLIERGYGEQLVVSHDVSSKMHRALYGGWGFGHILRNVIPLMELYEVPHSAIESMLVSTPRRLLTINSQVLSG